MIEERGSVKERIVHPALLRERAKIDFDQLEMTQMLWKVPNHKYRKEVTKFAGEHTFYKNKPEFYNQSWVEKMTTMMEKFYEFNKRIKELGIKINTM